MKNRVDEVVLTDQHRRDIAENPATPRAPVIGSQQLFHRPRLTTDEAAELLRVQPQTLRKAYSQRGSYGSLKPVKCAFNRRLYWSADDVRRLIEGEAA